MTVQHATPVHAPPPRIGPAEGGVLVAFVRMHAFEVGKHDVPIEGVPMLGLSVLDHVIGQLVFVVADEISTATWARLFVHHRQSFMVSISAAEQDSAADKCPVDVSLRWLVPSGP